MSTWRENRLEVDFNNDKAKISWMIDQGTLIAVNNLPFNQPGEQKESETKDAVRAAAKRALQALLDQL